MANCSKVLDALETLVFKTGNDLHIALQLQKDNEEFKEYLEYVYDTTRFVYGVHPEAPDNLDSLDGSSEPFSSFVSELHTVINAGVAIGKELANNMVQTYGHLAVYVFNRRIPGITMNKAVILKAIPGINLSVFNVAKAKPLKFDKIEYPVSCERKYDGNNVYIIDGELYTRTGRHIPRGDLQLTMPDNIKDYVICAEACTGFGRLGDRNKVQGIITKLRKQATHVSQAEFDEITFYVLDILTKKEWSEKRCYTGYNKRRERIPGLYMYSAFGFTHSYICNNEGEVRKFLANELSNGYEGIVVKPVGHVYEWKRTANWMRVKEQHTVDLVVIGWEEGTGKNEGLLGAILCCGYLGNITINVKVGIGFSDKMRQDFVLQDWLHKIVEIGYNDITADGSLTIPVFLGMRSDKEDSYNE